MVPKPVLLYENVIEQFQQIAAGFVGVIETTEIGQRQVRLRRLFEVEEAERDVQKFREGLGFVEGRRRASAPPSA